MQSTTSWERLLVWNALFSTATAVVLLVSAWNTHNVRMSNSARFPPLCVTDETQRPAQGARRSAVEENRRDEKREYVFDPRFIRCRLD